MTTLIASIASTTSSPVAARMAPWYPDTPNGESGFRAMAIESEAAPPEVGGTYSAIHASAIADSGEVAFSASLKDSSASSAILLSSAGTTRVILKSGDAAPGGGNYKSFSDLDLAVLSLDSERETIALFRAVLEGSPVAEGLFLWRPTGVEVLALAGQTSPRGNTYKSFSNLSIITAHPTRVLFRLAFVATMEEGTKSVLIRPSSDELFESLATGDVIGPNANEVVDDFDISRLGYSMACVVQVHRKKKTKNRYNKVITIDAFLVVGDALKEGVRFPVLGKVKHIFEPPAMNFQQGYASIEFKSGVSALATRDIDGASEIFAKSGEVVSDAPGEAIQSFGPPISSSLHLVGFDEFGEVTGPFGIVSPVRLSGGQTALWLGVITHKVPSLEGMRRLLLIGGSATLDGEEIILSAFSALKLTNTGTLLVRGTLGDGDQGREGLFVFEGLFGDQWRR